jgi:hypothetical protein
MALTSCAIVNASFTPEAYVINSEPKEDYNSVEYLAHKPQRAALRIGVISTNGNGFADFNDLIKKTKKKAAKLGGDFILAEKSGVDSQTVYSPGYSTYKANAHASYSSYSGYGSSQANGYSVGPSVNTVHRPWSVFSIWVYSPSQLGLRFGENYCVNGFHLNSDGEKAGIKIGDQLLGVDGVDVRDQAFFTHFMKVAPGDKVQLVLLRDTQRKECEITAVAN